MAFGKRQLKVAGALVLGFLIASIGGTAQETESRYDLLIRGGKVIDPLNNIDRIMDLAISGGKIVAVAESISPSAAKKALDAEGFLIAPGLIDLHTHVYGYGARLNVFPDTYALPNGVTTVVDAGSAGWKSFPDFKERVIDHSIVRTLAFLNIVGAGMMGEIEQEVGEMDPEAAAAMVRKHAEIIVGIKTAHFGKPGWDAVDRAVEAGRLSGTPVMIDFMEMPGRSYADLLLKHMRPGDIHTHMYAAHLPLLDEQGHVQEFVREARRRGIMFDVGHGAGSFWFRIAKPALDQDFGPDTISTDYHKDSALLPNAAMLVTMSKFLNLGMPLQEVILRSTVQPARLIHRPELGTLSVGAVADVALLRLDRGRFGFVDSGHAKMSGDQLLQCVLVLRAGKVAWDPNGLTWPDWKQAGKYKVLQ